MNKIQRPSLSILRLFFGVSLAFIFFVVLDCASNAQDSTNSAKPSVDKNKSQAQSASSSPAGAAEKSTTVPKPANPASPLAPAVTAPASTGIQKPSAAASSQTLSSRIEEGKKLYEKFSCADCHQIQKSGGFLGPSLDGIGSLKHDDIYAQIMNAEAHSKTVDKFFSIVPTSMPKTKATPDEVQKITDYLLSLPAR